MGDVRLAHFLKASFRDVVLEHDTQLSTKAAALPQSSNFQALCIQMLTSPSSPKSNRAQCIAVSLGSGVNLCE